MSKLTHTLLPGLQISDEKAFASSLDIARHFEKRHDNVLRDVQKIIDDCPADFGLLNFEESTYLNEQGKEQPCFNLTRDGFSLLAMGFTGKKALEWKVKYIEAFNFMENALRQNAAALSDQHLAALNQLTELAGRLTAQKPALPELSEAQREALDYVPNESKRLVVRELCALAKKNPGRASSLEGDFLKLLWCMVPSQQRRLQYTVIIPSG